MTIKEGIKKLEARRSKYNSKISDKIRALKDSCKHAYKYYEWQRDNYDQDWVTGYKCNLCDTDISVSEFKATKEYALEQKREREREERQQLQILKDKYES